MNEPGVYLQEASTHSNQGRPLDTVLRAALVAADTHQGRHFVTLLCNTINCPEGVGGVPTLLGPITLFFIFFLDLGSGSLSPSALGSMNTKHMRDAPITQNMSESAHRFEGPTWAGCGRSLAVAAARRNLLRRSAGLHGSPQMTASL